MLLWLLAVPFNFLFALLAYLTNPIVVLFANEEGELPGFLHYWQTWDDSLDVDFFVSTVVPSFLNYGYDKKYTCIKGTTPRLAYLGQTRYFSILKEGATFSLKERIQRYFCRVLWLYRNNAYGFSFYFFGRPVAGADMHYPVYDKDFRYGYQHLSRWWLDGPWVIWSERKICTLLGYDISWKVYLGWKIYGYGFLKEHRMLANRIWFKFRKAKK